MRALYSYCSRELIFDKGDIIDVLESTADLEYWTGSPNGVVGTFPRVYCEVIETLMSNEGGPEPAFPEEPSPCSQEAAFSNSSFSFAEMASYPTDLGAQPPSYRNDKKAPLPPLSCSSGPVPELQEL